MNPESDLDADITAKRNKTSYKRDSASNKNQQPTRKGKDWEMEPQN